MNAHFDTAAVLIDKGADPNVADSTGMTALYVAVDMHTLGPMLSRPSPKLVDKIDAADVVQAAAGARRQSERPAEAADHRPAPHADRRCLARRRRDAAGARREEQRPAGDAPAVRRRRRSAARRSRTGRRCAMIAAAGGAVVGAYAVAIPVTEESSLEAIRLCVEHGVDVNAFNTNGLTALHNAVTRGSLKIVRVPGRAGREARPERQAGPLCRSISRSAWVAAGSRRRWRTWTRRAPSETMATLLRSLHGGRSGSGGRRSR